MKRKIRLSLGRLGRFEFLIALNAMNDVSLAEKRVKPWFAANGDATLRLDYDLNNESIVFDIGGYMGQWSSDIFAKYCCTIHCFEPLEAFASRIEERFARNNKIIVHHFGMSDRDTSAYISHMADGSSTLRGEGEEVIQLVEANRFITQNGIERIDLMKINIEGGEYDLLEHLIETDVIRRIVDIQVQFHDFVPNAEARMLKIQNELRNTHFLTYQYPFVWENWRLNPIFRNEVDRK